MTLTKKLQTSIMMETMKNLVEMGYNQFYCNPESLDIKDLHSLSVASRMIGKVGYAVAIEYEIEKRS